jgi:hypothetical protein
MRLQLIIYHSRKVLLPDGQSFGLPMALMNPNLGKINSPRLSLGRVLYHFDHSYL